MTGGKTVLGGQGNDVLTGVTKDVGGGSGDDRIENPSLGPISGGDGYDTLALVYAGDADGLDFSFTYTDTGIHLIDGGAGGDTITGGSGFDYVRGGADDDTVDVRDGQVDRVLCGSGDDTVKADRTDLLRDCEHVNYPPPQTGAIKGPTQVRKGASARFTFTSSVSGSTFQCKLDSAAFKSCKSPYALATTKLAKGKHTLKVRAVQPTGNPDRTPSKATFGVT